MPQLFTHHSNWIARASILGGLGLVTGVLVLLGAINRSEYTTDVGQARAQPVPFSHARHVAMNGIDCRYCHTSVEESGFAGIPPTETCMSCHSQVLVDAPMLEPVRESYRTGKPIQWARVHDVPDFVYFNHSIHIAKGVGCESCHGRVDKMPMTWKVASMQMEWCLDCHRDPAKNLRPKDKVFEMGYRPAGDQHTIGDSLVKAYNINLKQLTNCSVCHR